ncbi:long-chain-fatty-acid--CoA ligase [Kytococcus sp. Marseille-QA3725]
MNIASYLVKTAERHPEACALIQDDARLTYAELRATTTAVAGYLRQQGLSEGDRLCLMLPNVIPYVPFYYAALSLGAVVVPMNPLLRDREITHYLQDSGATHIVALGGELGASMGGDVAAVAERLGVTAHLIDPATGLAPFQGDPVTEVVDRDPEDTAVILYTSGTTGVPKGAELTQANIHTNVLTTQETLIHLEPGEVVMGCLPLFHVFGMTCALNTSVQAGATLTLLPRFEASAALAMVERDRVSVFEGVPTMYGALVAAARARQEAGEPPVDVSSLRRCVSGGSSLPMETIRAFEETFGAEILEGYGLSETSPVASFNHPGDTVPGTVGRAVRGVEVGVVDPVTDQPVAPGEVGEVVVRGDCVMKGYWRNEEATATALRGGWFHSGDLGRLDEDGRLSIVDRVKDMVVRGGLNVYPREVEEVLYEHPDVLEAAVTGTPHPELGEEVTAYVVPQPGVLDEAALNDAESPAAKAFADALREHTKGELAAYKYPRHVHLLPELPKGPTGKILKRELG